MLEAALLASRRPSHLLFMCVANSARSQMAEGLARQLASAAVRISSAGSAPTQVRPEAVAALAELDIDITDQRSNGVDAIDLDSVEAVITLCAEEVCPVLPGPMVRLHWALPDPAGPGDRTQEFRDTRDELKRRLEKLFS